MGTRLLFGCGCFLLCESIRGKAGIDGAKQFNSLEISYKILLFFDLLV